MKRQWLIFFLIALIAELGTTWLQSRYHVVTDIPEGEIYYPTFAIFLETRVIIWLLLYLALTTVWLLVKAITAKARKSS